MDALQEKPNVSRSVEEKVAAIVADQAGMEAAEVTRDRAFVADLPIDSLDIVEIMMSIEEEFDITIPDEDVESMKTVGDAVDYVIGQGG